MRKANTYRAARRNATVHRKTILLKRKVKALRQQGWRRWAGMWIAPEDERGFQQVTTRPVAQR